MDLIIRDASLEQITIVCSRIANPSFDEMLDDERLSEIAKYINKGDSPNTAKQKWEEDMTDKAEAYVTEPDGTKRITRGEIKKELGIEEPVVRTEVTKLKDLHLDGAPPEKPTINLNEVIRVAGELAKQGKVEFIHETVAKYGVEKVRQLKPENWQPVYDALSEALNG